MSHLPNFFSIALVAHAWENDAPIKDVFMIYGQTMEMFKITFIYQIGGKEGNESATVECLSDFGPSDLPFICNSIHLIAVIHKWLCDMLNEQSKEFYNDIFLDEEDERATYSINDLIFGGK